MVEQTDCANKLQVLWKNVGTLLYSYYYIQAFDDKQNETGGLVIPREIAEVSKRFAYREFWKHWVWQNQIIVVLAVYRLVVDESNESWTLDKHKNYLARNFGHKISAKSFSKKDERWKRIRTYRNKALAHSEPEFDSLELMMRDAYSYIADIVDKFNELAGFSDPSLVFTKKLLKQIEDECQKAIDLMVK